jgi:DHA1 family bicyclomycin/chloramphenicol resistance-like MFS transporter
MQYSVAAAAATLVGMLQDVAALPMALVISLCGALPVRLQC